MNTFTNQKKESIRTNSRVTVVFPVSSVLSAKVNTLGIQEGRVRFHALPPLQKGMDNGDS